MRRLFLLVLCSGCDLVIPLDEPEPAACGPYANITPVAFDAVLEDPSDFSVDYEGLHGMVHARVPAGMGTYTGPVPIVLVDGVWMLDADRFPRGMPKFDLDGGHMLGDGSVFGWRDAIPPSTPPQLHRYLYVAPAWTVDGLESQLESDLTRNPRPGNEIVLDVGFGGNQRFFPQVRIDFQTGKRNQLVIRQKFVTMPWLATDQADKLADLDGHEITAAVMTLDHAILIYAARTDGGKQRLFTSVRDREDQFVVGRPIDLDSDEALDDSEPWIAQDCSVLYFRRGGITYRAQ